MTQKTRLELEKRIEEWQAFHGQEVTGIEEFSLPSEMTAVKLHADFFEIVYGSAKQGEDYLAYSHAHLLDEDNRDQYDELMMAGEFKKARKLVKPVDIYYIDEIQALILMPRNKKGIFKITERGIE